MPLNFDWDTKCSVCLTLTHTHPVPQRPPGPLCHKGALWLASLAVNTLPSRDAVDECPRPFMTSAETVCFSCTFCTAGSCQEHEVAVCPGHLVMGTMDGFLQSGNLYWPGLDYAPDPDTSCLALERQRMHSLGLDRVVVKTFQAPTLNCQGKVYRDW